MNEFPLVLGIIAALSGIISVVLCRGYYKNKQFEDPEILYIPTLPMEDPKPAPAPVPVPVTVPTPSMPKYLWDTVGNARHSVRVICDEEGLTVDQKNDLCATVGAESGWQSYYLSGPKKGQPVKLDNVKGGVVWSTDWGIAQVNDWFNIKQGFSPAEAALRHFPTHQYVLDNPEACIRWMCTQWKAGNADWWIAHKNGSYKKFL